MGFIREIKKNSYLYLLAVPGILFLMVFAYIPMSGHIIAFKELDFSKGLFFSPWVGFDNFKFLFQNREWLTVTLNTLKLNSLFIVFGLGGAVIIALFLNEVKNAFFKRITQSLIFMPYFISWMVVSFMIFTIFNTSNGLLNKVLESLGKEAVSWYSQPKYWPAILTIMYIWKQAGYFSIIFLSSIVGISAEYYESARIDGASRIQQIFYVTLPLIRPTIIVMALLAVGKIFYGDFGMIYSIIGDNGTLFSTTDVIDTFSYRAMRKLGNFGMASSVVLYQAVMGMVTVLIFNKVAKRVEQGSELF